MPYTPISEFVSQSVFKLFTNISIIRVILYIYLSNMNRLVFIHQILFVNISPTLLNNILFIFQRILGNDLLHINSTHIFWMIPSILIQCILWSRHLIYNLMIEKNMIFCIKKSLIVWWSDFYDNDLNCFNNGPDKIKFGWQWCRITLDSIKQWSIIYMNRYISFIYP